MATKITSGTTPTIGELYAQRAPWWATFALAGAVAFVCLYLLPAVFGSNFFVRALMPMLIFGGLLVTGILCVVAGVQWFVQRRDTVRGSGLATPLSMDPIVGPYSTPLPARDHREVWRDAPPEPRAPEERPAGLSINLLREIEWKHFEELAAGFYREVGLRSETIAHMIDGAIAAALFEEDSKAPLAIVQCKAWTSRQVGITSIRELIGLMTQRKVGHGIYITTGGFTAEAATLAKSHGIDLIAGNDFLLMITKLDAPAQARLLAVATEGDFRTPSCPNCGIKMIAREGERGRFWGCGNFPRCRVRIHAVSRE